MSSSRNMQSTFISDPSNDLIEQAIQQPGVVQVVRRHHSRKRHHTRRSTSPQFSPNDINEENDRNFEGNIEEYSPDGPNLIPPSFSRRGASFSQSVHPSLTQQNIEQFDQPISNHFLSQSMRDLKNVRNSPHSNAQNNNQSQFQDISYENRQGPLVERLSSPNRGSHVSRQLVRARDISSPNDPIYEKTLYHSKSRRRYKSTKRTFSPTGNDEYIPGHIEPIQQSDVELQYHIDGEQDDADDFLQPDQHKLYNQQQTREFHSQLDPQIINQMNKPQLSPQIRSPSPTIPSIKKGNLFINDGIPDQRNPVYTDINMSNIIDPYNNADNNGISQQEQYHRDQHIERQIKNYRQRIDDLEEEQDQQQNEYDRIQQQEYEQEQEQLKRQRQMQIKRQMDKQKQNSIQLDREYVRQRERAIQRQRQLEQQQLEQENLLLGQQQQQQIQEFDQIIEEEVEEEEQNERRDYIRRNGFNGTEEEEEEYVQGERKTRSFQSPSNINTRSSIFSLNQPQINQKQQIQQYNRERERQIEQEQERIEQEIEQKERIEREMQQQEDERQLQLQKEKYRLELQKKQLEAEKQHQLQLQKEKLEQDRIDIQVRERELIEKEKEQERQQKQKEQERKEKERQKEQIMREREEKRKELEQEQKKMNEKYEQERLLEQRRRQSPIRTSPTRLVVSQQQQQSNMSPNRIQIRTSSPTRISPFGQRRQQQQQQQHQQNNDLIYSSQSSSQSSSSSQVQVYRSPSRIPQVEQQQLVINEQSYNTPIASPFLDQQARSRSPSRSNERDLQQQRQSYSSLSSQSRNMNQNKIASVPTSSTQNLQYQSQSPKYVNNLYIPNDKTTYSQSYIKINENSPSIEYPSEQRQDSINVGQTTLQLQELESQQKQKQYKELQPTQPSSQYNTQSSFQHSLSSQQSPYQQSSIQVQQRYQPKKTTVTEWEEDGGRKIIREEVSEEEQGNGQIKRLIKRQTRIKNDGFNVYLLLIDEK